MSVPRNEYESSAPATGCRGRKMATTLAPTALLTHAITE